MPSSVRIWDLPIRFFHWSLALLVVFSYTTGTIGGTWLDWHMRSGYAILALLLFRIAWGFVGSDTARFTRFVRSPVAAIGYLRDLARGVVRPAAGHNPAGGWMVLALLAALLVQAVAGLFADDEIATQGPLAVKASNAFVSLMTRLHDFNQWVLVGLVVLHVVAIIVYQWRYNLGLTRLMVTGTLRGNLAPGLSAPRMRSTGLALACLAIASALVYALVVVYPGMK
jgi:cytochrome b